MDMLNDTCGKCTGETSIKKARPGWFGRAHWESYLFATVRWQIEHQYGEEANAHAGNDEVHRVEQRLPAHRNVERDVEVRLVAAGVKLFISVT